ncbi:hypothetical protein [Tardiphaga sp. 862_B3_N1_1]|uniref:hypothetical protein n=1 Tax=Tardiphaga sp. 862_B3_N1_1 TaxID=3240763 RepID=UPI003F8A99FD
MIALLPYLPSALLALVAVASVLSAGIIGRSRKVPSDLLFVAFVAVVASCSSAPGVK